MPTDAVSSHDSADYFEQKGFWLRFGWGPNGLRRLAPAADAVVIVDVLSFSTSVDVALGRGAIVLPYRWHDGNETAYAEEQTAVVAAKSPAPGQLSLRPSSLVDIEPGTRLVLPSPNGSALAFAATEAGAGTVYLGCLRNAAAVAAAAAQDSETVAVIGAGERWRGATGPLRPAVEDLLGAGSIIDALAGLNSRAASISPEARAAAAAFTEAKSQLLERLTECGSGQELIDRGFTKDVALAADYNCSSMAPKLEGLELVGSA